MISVKMEASSAVKREVEHDSVFPDLERQPERTLNQGSGTERDTLVSFSGENLRQCFYCHKMMLVEGDLPDAVKIRCSITCKFSEACEGNVTMSDETEELVIRLVRKHGNFNLNVTTRKVGRKNKLMVQHVEALPADAVGDPESGGTGCRSDSHLVIVPGHMAVENAIGQPAHAPTSEEHADFQNALAMAQVLATNENLFQVSSQVSSENFYP